MKSDATEETPFNCLGPARYGQMLYNPNDCYSGRSYKLYGEWKEHEIQTFRPYIQPGMVVLDVGANIGQHTVFFARAVGAKGSILAFEPQRLFFQTLCANVALNSLTKVYTHQAAVGAESAPGSVAVPVRSPWIENHNFSALPLWADYSQEACETIDMIAIDDLHLSRCDFMKIEVVGMEEDVIRGAVRTIQRLKPVLYVENDLLGYDIDQQKSSGEIIKENTVRRHSLVRILAGLGYQLYWDAAPYFNSDNYLV